MDRPAGSAPSSQQRGTISISSIQNILDRSCPSPSQAPSQGPPTLPPLLTVQQQNARSPPGPSCEAADRQHQFLAAYESDLAKEDHGQPSTEAGAKRRSINSSKRAAQNRAAQRAFRLRRERYVAGLEEKARSYNRLEVACMEIQRENHQLRARMHQLQSENTALRAHIATTTPASLPPPSATAAPFPLSAATQPMPGAVGMHPVSIAEHSGSSYQYTSPAHSRQQPRAMHQHVHVLRPEYAHHAPGYAGTTHLASSLSLVGPTHIETVHHAGQLPPQLPQPQGRFSSGSVQQHPHSPCGAQCMQHHGAVQKQFQRDHSWPRSLDSRSPVPSPAPLAMAPAHLTKAFPSPGGSRMDVLQSAADQPLQQPGAGSGSIGSSASTPVAPVLPSVREITMSIGAMQSSSPCVDHSPSPQPPPNKGCAGRGGGSPSVEYIGVRRRPW